MRLQELLLITGNYSKMCGNNEDIQVFIHNSDSRYFQLDDFLVFGAVSGPSYIMHKRNLKGETK